MREGRKNAGIVRGAIIAFAFACLMMLTPSLATAGWSSPTVVSGVGNSTSQTQIAGGADGSSWVIWKRDVGGFDVIQGTKVQVDGSQGPIVTFSAPTSQADRPVIKTRADGSGMVAWLNLSALDDTVHSRSIAADGTLGPIESRSAVGPAGQPAADIAVALGGDGTAALTWRKFNGSDWVVQAVKVAADGTGGPIHEISDPVSTVGNPAIAAEPPAISTDAFSYRLAWPQGVGDAATVYSRAIYADDTVEAEIYKAIWPRIPQNIWDPDDSEDGPDPIGPGTGGDPQEVQIEYGDDRVLTIAWLRHRADYIINGVVDSVSHDPSNRGYNPSDPLDTPFYNWAVEMIRGVAGVPPSNTRPLEIKPLTPTVQGDPYNVRDFDMSNPFGGRPVMAWIHDLNGGDSRVETGRIRRNGEYAEWSNATRAIPAAQGTVIAANALEVAVTGWSVPGVSPGQDEVSWTRFSNATSETFSPTGGFLYSTDPGFVVADSGISLGAFTAIDGANNGTSQISIFKDPGIRVDPPTVSFGNRNIGSSSTRFISIRSAGETPVEVTDIALSGPDAASYTVTGTDACTRAILPANNCQLPVKFVPSSTAVQTAKVTITSEVGIREVTLSGAGLNKTRNQITVTPRRKAVRKGKVVNLRAQASNLGGVASASTQVCVRLNQRALRLAGDRCRSLGSLAAGASQNLNFRVRVTWRARLGARLPVTFLMRSGNAVIRQTVANVGRRR